tara:strand:+ start:266 stop:445 length:180 start_codon:yes stop_codon:yes gene_type:complete
MKNHFTTLFALITILAPMMAVGAIEDCGGHCLGNENWSMFFVMIGVMIVSGIITIKLQD